jgi:hypothetical protein
MVRAGLISLSLGMGLLTVQACEEGLPSDVAESEGPLVLQASEKKLDHLSVCAPSAANFPSPLTSTNPYFPIIVDYQWTLEGEEDGVPVKLLMTVLDETRLIDEVMTRVVEEREWEDDKLSEVSWNYFAETADGTVCYFGEDVDDIEEGEIFDHEGRWCAQDDPDVNKAGIIMPADPQPGLTFQNEDAPDAGAVDQAKIVGSGPVTVPYNGFTTFTETIRFREFNPEDKEKDYKVFAMDLATGFGGIIIDEVLALTGFTQNAVDPGDPITEQVCGS